MTLTTTKIGNKQYVFTRSKADPNIKKIYLVKGKDLEKIFEGDASEREKYIDHLKKLAGLSEYRHTIADMCGTSYRAACEDMGISAR